MQRAAIARSVIHKPALLIADEPTGNLDSDNGEKVLKLLGELNREIGITILLATHSAETAAAAGRPVPIVEAEAVKTAGQMGSEYTGWLNFQPLYAKIVALEPDLLS